MTWSRFLIKNVEGNQEYKWTKLNILTQFSSPGNHIMLVFDAVDTTPAMLLQSLMDGRQNDQMSDPFWIYYRFLNDVTILHDASIWRLRDRVRVVEKSSAKSSEERPDYRKLHDLARHAIHIAETTAVTISTMQSIHAAHRRYAEGRSPAQPASFAETVAWKHIQDRLLYYEQVCLGFQKRAEALNDRLRNEIQLSFNTVTQQDSDTTIKISKIAQGDSNVMRMIAYLTLMFLPATFISAVFSTSFFNFNPDEKRWSVSDKFWIFWAFSVPVTIVTVVMCHHLGLSVSGRKVAN